MLVETLPRWTESGRRSSAIHLPREGFQLPLLPLALLPGSRQAEMAVCAAGALQTPLFGVHEATRPASAKVVIPGANRWKMGQRVATVSNVQLNGIPVWRLTKAHVWKAQAGTALLRGCRLLHCILSVSGAAVRRSFEVICGDNTWLAGVPSHGSNFRGQLGVVR